MHVVCWCRNPFCAGCDDLLTGTGAGGMCTVLQPLTLATQKEGLKVWWPIWEKTHWYTYTIHLVTCVWLFMTWHCRTELLDNSRSPVRTVYHSLKMKRKERGRAISITSLWMPRSLFSLKKVLCWEKWMNAQGHSSWESLLVLSNKEGFTVEVSYPQH